MHGDRLYYMDNLRALALLAGVAFHAALAYSPLAHGFFPTADRVNSVYVDGVAWFLHLFRMPLFFAIAGFFTAVQVQRHGLAGMFRSRFRRLVVPFVLLVPAINFWLKAATLHAAIRVDQPSPLLRAIGDLLHADGLPPMPPGTGHLWFLYYLMLFITLLWAARALDCARIGAWVADRHPLWHLAVWPLALAPAIAAVPAPHPAPESLLPQFWALTYYGSFFMFGYLMRERPAIALRHRAIAVWLLVGSLALYTAYFALLRSQLSGSPHATMWSRALSGAAISVWMTIASFCLARTMLDRPLSLLRPFADASYWTYVVHLPVLIPIQYVLMDLDMPWPAKLVIALALTLAVCMASYYTLVRRTRLDAFFGRPAWIVTGPANT